MLDVNDPLIQTLPVNQFVEFLTLDGWKHVTTVRDRFAIFAGPLDDGRDPIEIAIPVNEQFNDYGRRIFEAVITLAELYERRPDDVISDIYGINNDTLYWRLPIEGNRTEISLELAAATIYGFQYLTRYSACTEANPRPYFTKPEGIGKRFAEHCKFGQTKPGSFIFQIVSPLTGPLLSDRPNGFARQVMERIVRGFQFVQKSVDDANPDVLVENYKEGFNANGLTVLAAMLEASEGVSPEFQPKWSPTISVPKDLVSNFKPIPSRTADILKPAIDKLKELGDAFGIKVTGRIVSLGRVTDGRDRTVVLEHASGERRRVNAILSPTDYVTACDAHRDRKAVSLTGDVHEHPKYLEMYNVTSFKVL